ncbi:ankyrin repeat and KH domain-containing protein 1-like [Penaeus monodon]|uniref:ankyrin repeat and KH domain-containing protein 1-like n=1 Tax=Penaeus monodon TaxID=6687 RepID=UPI0018A72DF3|nr:ankyrin repeat and KH domain-containing protein 1-like [Penaeus monodon]XP_037803427.1 ankyrin repeat and KH domain-containing protein 1-like [Penaeus monodon]
MADLPCMCPAPVLGTLPEEQCRDVADGDVGAVLRWLDYGGDVNAANRWGNTLLSLACSNGHADVVEALMKRPNLHLNLRNGENDKPLSIAAANGHWDIVDMLLRTSVRCHIDVHEESTEEQMTPIMHTAEAGEWQLVHAFFERNYKLKEDEAAFVIVMAGEFRAWKTILTILRKDYHFVPERFVPVLDAAYEEDAWDVICAFLRQGFPNRFDDVNYWLSRAVLSKKWRGVQELLWLLKKDIVLDTNIIEAAVSDQMETMKKLFEQIDHDKDTVDGTLLVASVAGCTEAVATYLLQQYAGEEQDVILPNSLYLAAMNNHLALLPLLLRNHIKCFSYESLSKAQEVAEKCECTNADRLLQKALEMKTKEVLVLDL